MALLCLVGDLHVWVWSVIGMRWRVMCARRVVGDGRFHGGIHATI